MTPMLCVVDPEDEQEVREFMRLISEGYKIMSASGMHHQVVYVLVKVTE